MAKPKEGDIWFNTGDGWIYVFKNGEWEKESEIGKPVEWNSLEDQIGYPEKWK